MSEPIGSAQSDRIETSDRGRRGPRAPRAPKPTPTHAAALIRAGQSQALSDLLSAAGPTMNRASRSRFADAIGEAACLAETEREHRALIGIGLLGDPRCFYPKDPSAISASLRQFRLIDDMTSLRPAGPPISTNAARALDPCSCRQVLLGEAPASALIPRLADAGAQPAPDPRWTTAEVSVLPYLLTRPRAAGGDLPPLLRTGRASSAELTANWEEQAVPLFGSRLQVFGPGPLTMVASKTRAHHDALALHIFLTESRAYNAGREIDAHYWLGEREIRVTTASPEGSVIDVFSLPLDQTTTPSGDLLLVLFTSVRNCTEHKTPEGLPKNRRVS